MADIGRPDRRGKRGVLREPRTVACKQCGVEFASTHGARVLCSPKCSSRFYYEARLADGRAHAPRSAVSVKDCEVCGTVYVARRSTSVACGEPCRRKFWAEHQRKRYHSDPEAAAQRERERRAARTDEQRERDRGKARAWREQAGYFESKRAGDQRRRAAKLAVEVEKFSTAEIYERDNWRCGICRKKVRKALSFPHPMSASLDHIVPLSQLGPHTRANVRLAHLSCNTARSNRGGGEQLALLG